MRFRSVVIISGWCLVAAARSAHAAPAGLAPSGPISVFESLIAQADDAASGPGTSASAAADGNDRDRYVVAAALGFGLMTYFLIGSSSGDEFIDQPSDRTPGPILPPHNDGGTSSLEPNLPVPDIFLDTTATPEPATLLLMGTGLSSLTFVSRRRRTLGG